MAGSTEQGREQGLLQQEAPKLQAATRVLEEVGLGQESSSIAQQQRRCPSRKHKPSKSRQKAPAPEGSAAQQEAAAAATQQEAAPTQQEAAAPAQQAAAQQEAAAPAQQEAAAPAQQAAAAAAAAVHQIAAAAVTAQQAATDLEEAAQSQQLEPAAQQEAVVKQRTTSQQQEAAAAKVSEATSTTTPASPEFTRHRCSCGKRFEPSDISLESSARNEIMASTVTANEVEKWSEEDVIAFLVQRFPQGDTTIREVITKNGVFGYPFLHYSKAEWEDSGASKGMASFLFGVASEIKSRSSSTKTAAFDDHAAPQTPTAEVTPSPVRGKRKHEVDRHGDDNSRGGRPRMAASVKRTYKQLDNTIVPTMAEVFVNYGKNGTAAGALALKKVGFYTQYSEMLDINRAIKKEVEKHFAMFTKVNFRNTKARWAQLREKVTKDLVVTGALLPLVFVDVNKISHKLSAPEYYVSERISNLLTQRRSRLKKAKAEGIGYKRRYSWNETEVDLLACDDGLALDDETLEFLTDLWQARFKVPMYYTNNLRLGGRAKVLKRRTIMGYSLLTVQLLSVIDTTFVVPHSRAKLEDLNEGGVVEWPECFTVTTDDPDLDEMDENDEDSSGDTPQRPAKMRKVQTMLPVAKKCDTLDKSSQAEKRMAFVTRELKLKPRKDSEQKVPAQDETKVPAQDETKLPAQDETHYENYVPRLGDTVSLLDPTSEEVVAFATVHAASGATTHNSVLVDEVRVIITEILPGKEDTPLPERATSDEDCVLLSDAVAYGNKTPLRWPVVLVKKKILDSVSEIVELDGGENEKNEKSFDVKFAPMRELKQFCKTKLGFDKLETIHELRKRIKAEREAGVRIPDGIEKIPEAVECFRMYVRFKLGR